MRKDVERNFTMTPRLATAFVESNHLAPLCVDLDGTLLKTDTLFESLLVLLRTSPLSLLAVAMRLLQGRAYFKEALSRRVTLAPGLLPYNREVLAFLREEKAKGRRLILATGANRGIASRIAKHLGLFDEVIASDASTNLSGKNKAAALVKRFGKGNFDYVGNGHADLNVWPCARKAIVVSADQKLLGRAQRQASVDRVFETKPTTIKTWLRALRIHQWAKNLLLFVPLFCSHRWNDALGMEHAILAFLSFSLCASSVYLLNDLVDIDSDRRHPTKRTRPFAGGALPLIVGILGSPLLLAAGITPALFVSLKFTATLAGYYCATMLYSFWVKRIELADVFLLAFLYGLRVLAGSVAVSVPISDWLLVFSSFFFLSLAFVKRFTELRKFQDLNAASVSGRGYRVDDIELVEKMGLSSGYVATLVLALYVSGSEVSELYARPHLLWLACPAILLWISRVWLMAHRGVMHEDPIVFALRDKQSYVMAVALAVILLGAWPK